MGRRMIPFGLILVVTAAICSFAIFLPSTPDYHPEAVSGIHIFTLQEIFRIISLIIFCIGLILFIVGLISKQFDKESKNESTGFKDRDKCGAVIPETTKSCPKCGVEFIGE